MTNSIMVIFPYVTANGKKPGFAQTGFLVVNFIQERRQRNYKRVIAPTY